jgi:hypothetical protein
MTPTSTDIYYHIEHIQKPNAVFCSIYELLKDDCITYFHSHTATPKELEAASKKDIIFEIDLAWASNLFIDNKNIRINQPYIGHPEKFYTEMKREFPVENVSLEQFKIFLKNNPSIKVLLDIKDQTVLIYLEEFIKEIGSHRCIVHAFIKDWTILPKEEAPEPHWTQEDIELAKLGAILDQLNVPLIANCRGFSDQHVKENKLIQKIIDDARKYKSIVCLGLYYPKAPIPEIDYLQAINAAGFHAWVNANDPQFQEKTCNIRYIAMQDKI